MEFLFKGEFLYMTRVNSLLRMKSITPKPNILGGAVTPLTASFSETNKRNRIKQRHVMTDDQTWVNTPFSVPQCVRPQK